MAELLPVSDAAPVVTFFSYKGGVGRSMAVLNVAALIASRGFRVLIIDFDLEAPGLSHLIRKSKRRGKSAELTGDTEELHGDGVVELLGQVREREQQADLFVLSPRELAERYTFPYAIPSGLHPAGDARLSIMPAGRLDSGYPARLDSLDLPSLYHKTSDHEPSPGQTLILSFKAMLTRGGEYDYIIIDSRTGHSDEAGICTRDLADHRIVVCGLNHQNVAGTATFLATLRTTFQDAGFPVRDPDIVLSPVPNSEDDLVYRRISASDDSFSKAWGKKLPLDLIIPYHPRLALTEEAYVPTLTASPLRDAYRSIESRFLRSLGHTKEALFDSFKTHVRQENGRAALDCLRRWAKLLGDRQHASPRMMLTTWWLRADDNDNLKKLLGLAEWLDILKTLARISSSEEMLEIARRLHRIDPSKATLLDALLIGLESFDADELGNYAVFLKNYSKDPASAEAYYERAIESDPKNANNLGNYAVFLEKIRKDPDAAETFYKRSIDADPKHASNLGNYAVFLEYIREDPDTAEAFYKRAIDADPKHANNLGNCGQFLLGRGESIQGLARLRAAWENLNPSDLANGAEISLALWLGTRLVGAEEATWERTFKFLISKGFDRQVWNFDAILAEAAKILKPAELEYARALAAAFVDESKVAALEKFPRWKKLQPLDPERLRSDGTVIET